MITVIKILILILSLMGYINYLVNVKKISFYIAPALLVASITALIYIAGILNIMPLTACFLLLFGIIIGFRYRKLFFKFKNNIEIDNVALICIFVLFLYIIYFTYGGVYEDGDTMTHWGIIVRVLIQYDRLPNFLNTEIMYQSYPPATACWIYFILKVVGYGEGRALFAQSLWMLVNVVTLFALNEKKDKLGSVFIAIFSLFLLQWMGGLRVDILLSTIVIAELVIISKYRREFYNVCLYGLPFFTVVPLVKNSGILFSAYATIILIVLAIIERRKLKDWVCILYLMLGSIVSWYLWETHIKIVYFQANNSRHSLSLNYMKNILDERTSDEINAIIHSFLSTWLSWNDSYEWISIIGLLIVTLVLFLLLKNKKVILVPILSLSAYFIYKICLLLMYLTNMPGKDALTITGYGRYQKTMSLVLLFVIVWMVFEYVISRIVVKKIIYTVDLLGIAFSCALIYTFPYSAFLRPDYLNEGSHRQMTHMLNEHLNGIEYGDKVISYSSHQFTTLFTRFTFGNQMCSCVMDVNGVEEILNENKDEYDYLVILDSDSEIKNVLNKYGYGGSEKCIDLSFESER